MMDCHSHHRSLGTGILVPGIVQNESTFNPHSLFQLRSPSPRFGAAPQNRHTGSFRGQAHSHQTVKPQTVLGTVVSPGFQPHTSTCLHLMIFTVINTIHPPWGLICTTVSHKSCALRTCQQLIDIQEQFPCLEMKPGQSSSSQQNAQKAAVK